MARSDNDALVLVQKLSTTSESILRLLWILIFS